MTRRAIAEGDSTAALRWLAACKTMKVNAAELRQLSTAIDRLRAIPPAVTQANVGSGATSVGRDNAPAGAAEASLAQPSAATAAVSVKPSPSVISAAKLTRTYFVAPVFPPAALGRGAHGWVELEYTVSATGAVKDIQIDAAQPRNVFDAAAQEAVSQWRYEPPLADGVPTDQRVRLRIRFEQPQ